MMGADLQQILYLTLSADSNNINETVECLSPGEGEEFWKKMQKSGRIPENQGGLATLV